MPLVSIITPTQVRNAEHIGELWRSLEEQVLPAGWEWEWVVQEDGERPGVRDLLPDDPRIRYDALGVQIGGAATRNTAVARARGELVAGMDHDDFYAPGGVGALVEPLAGDPSVAWACGRMRWVNPDGGSWVKPDVYPTGRVEAGVVADGTLTTEELAHVYGAYSDPAFVDYTWLTIRAIGYRAQH